MNNKKSFPPKAALRLLSWFCPNELYEEIEGDLIYKFNKDVNAVGEKKAKRRLLWNAARFFRPGILFRNRITIPLIPIYMLLNYFKIALRIMLRNKGYSIINISGLTLGLTGALLLGLWIEKEFSYDQFHTDKERIYKVWNKQKHKDGGADCWNATPRVLASTLTSDFTSFEKAISFAQYTDTYKFSVGETKLMKNEAYFTDPEFLQLFSFPLIKGDAKKALDNPNSIVLTERFARQLFGDKEAFGETVTVSQTGFDIPFTVTGILKDLPSNTDIRFDYLISFQFIESNFGKDSGWGNNSLTTWVKLKENTSLASVNDQIRDLKKKHTKNAEGAELFLYPMTKDHLYSRFENGVPAGGRIEIIRMLGVLGVFLVAIACINFINLSTARGVRRSKEVAVRKVTGAFRLSIMTQFLCESILVAMVAGIISLGAVYLALPFFNVLIRQQLALNVGDIAFWITLLMGIVVVGVLAGGYPAFFLSSFQPVRILKGMSVGAGSKQVLRTLLVIIQFGFALTLIVSTIVVYQQTMYLQNRETGYDKNNLIYQYSSGDLIKNFTAYKTALIQSGAAVSVTRTSSPITQRMSNTNGIKWKGKDPNDLTLFERFNIDEGIASTTGVTIIKGRDMNLEKYPSDSTAVVLNEAAVKAMGFEDPIGEIIEDNGVDWRVVGVVRDFVLTSPHRRVEPILLQGCFGIKYGMLGVIHIRLNPAHGTQENIEAISNAFAKYNPDYPFDFQFVDIEHARKFSDIQTTLTITGLFSGIAIFIGCLGLLGLATYMIEARIKEIGIRKVMGGSALSIVKLLSSHSLKPILWAIVIFSPGAWYSMNWWLQSFQYRISFSAWTIVIAALSIITLALSTIIAQVYRASQLNPAKTLRSE